jgi:methionyl-tRNA synthetase
MDSPIKHDTSASAPIESAVLPGKPKPLIKFADFEKLDLRVGEVISCEPHPNADKLIILTVNFGDLGFRTICAGIKEFVRDPTWMENKRFVFCVNLGSRVMRGVKSEGMILAASNDDSSLLVPVEVGMVLNKGEAIASENVLAKGGWKVS